MIAGSYVLHLYCDAPGCEARDFGHGEGSGLSKGHGAPVSAEFVAESGPRARQRARRSGWQVGRMKCRCPRHNRRRARSTHGLRGEEP